MYSKFLDCVNISVNSVFCCFTKLFIWNFFKILIGWSVPLMLYIAWLTVRVTAYKFFVLTASFVLKNLKGCLLFYVGGYQQQNLSIFGM